MTEERLAKLEEQAYAKIIWGEPAEEIRGFLLGAGVTNEDAKRIIRDAFRDRAAEIRKQGITDISIGIGGILLGTLLAGGYRWFSTVVYVKIAGLLAIPAFYGIYRVFRGIPRLIMGKEHGAVSDLS